MRNPDGVAPGELAHQPRRVDGEALFGVAAVALMLGGTRWAAYLGAPPIFFADLLLALALMHRWATYSSLAGAREPWSGVGRPSHLLYMYVAWTAVRFTAQPEFSIEAARDVVPYLYCGVGILAAADLARSTNVGRQRTFRWLRTALAFHAAAYIVVQLVPSLPERLPLVSAPDIHILSIRGDVDAALTGVYAAWLLARVLRGDRSFLSLLGFLVCWFAVLHTLTRAGFIGALLPCMFVLVAMFGLGVTGNTRRALVIILMPLLFAGILAVIPDTDVGQRIAGTVGLSSSSTMSQSGSGTADARARAWSKVLEYSFEDPGRALFGVGFGPNFLADSGAGVLLVGSHPDLTTRNPHNYWLGTLARLGLIGIGIFGALVFSSIRAGWRKRRVFGDDPLLLLVTIIPLSLIVPLALGVVLESPFGAIPFFWCVGLLLAYPDATHYPPGKSDARESRGTSNRTPEIALT